MSLKVFTRKKLECSALRTPIAYLKSLMVTVATSVFSLPAKIADHLSQTTPQLSLSHILENYNIAKKKVRAKPFPVC